jgi:hypothetical protein
MKKKLLVSAAMAVVMMANVIFSVDAQAVSRTTTTEVISVARSLDEILNGGAQVLGARRSSDSAADNSVDSTAEVRISTIVNATAQAAIATTEVPASIVTEYTKSEVKASELTVLDSMEVSVAEDVVVSKEKPIYLTFSFPGITAKTEAYVLHYGRNGWEVVPTTVLDGMVIGEFTSLSPVAVVVKTSTLKGSVLGSGRKTSPRTGDNFWLIVIAGAGVIAISAVALQKKFFHD